MALRFVKLANSSNSFLLLAVSFFCMPAYRALYTPGSPFNASTSNPLSSAITAQGSFFLINTSATYLAFISELSLIVSPVSGISSVIPMSSKLTNL